MDKPKFTPGPWEQSHREVMGRDGLFTVVYRADDPDNLIASLHWHSVKTDKGWTTDRAANAHLIAAAPDMYEALEDTAALAAALTSHTIRINGQYVEVREAVARARAALAKARGEA